MDDWNDFGAAPAPAPTNVDQPSAAISDHSRSYDDSASDGSVGLLASSGSGSSSSSYTTSPTATPGPQQDPARETSHSFLSSLPFIGSRKADRQAAERAAAAQAAAMLANISTTPPAVVVPVTRSDMADRRVDDMEGVSVASESDDAREPASRMMPRTVANVNVNADGEADNFDDDDIPFVPIRGELDDVPDDFELNIHGFRYITIRDPASVDDLEEGQSSVIASSLLRPIEKSYTKLEVISAKQIRILVYIFNCFVFIASILTFFTIGISHTKFKQFNEVPIPEDLLYEHQIKQSTKPFFPVPANCPPHCPPPVVQPRSLGMKEFRKTFFPPALNALYIESLKKGGLYPTIDGISEMPTSRIVLSESGIDDYSYSRTNFHTIAFPPHHHNSTSVTLRQPSDPSNPLEGLDLIYAVFLNTTTAIVDNKYKNTSHFLCAIMGIFFIALSALYGIRLLRQGRRNISHEQVWVFLLLVVTCLYFNPIYGINRLVETIGQKNIATKFAPWFRRWDIFNDVVRDLAFATFSYFYLWISLHSYRILDPTKRLGWRFYLPKFVVLIPYLVFKLLAFYIIDLTLSEVPALSGIAFAFFFGSYNVWGYLRVELLYTITASAIELILIGFIVYEAIRTTQVLERAPYMKHRTKRVGFRFFLYTNFVFYALFIGLHLLLVFSRPKGEYVIQMVAGLDVPKADVLWYHTMGPSFLVFGYVLVTAYVHLPYNCLGFVKCWFTSSVLAESGSRWSFSSADSESTEQSYVTSTGIKNQISGRNGTWANDEETPRSVVDNDDELQQQIVEPITYRKRESKDSLELKANCFTMQTHVIMFNFAWYVYYYGTTKLDKFRPKENPLPFDYKIAAHIKCETTDTQVLVVDCSDRIIVTFKGTTSMRNLKTSLRMSHEYLRNVVNSSVYGEDETMRLKRLFGRKYLLGKIHKGFAIAYKSVADEVMSHVRQLRARRQRPVFLTGHSLGGALATICSLDLWVKLDVSRREIFVSTFGSPRVGNADFANVYKEVVPLHWRIVVDPDMVAKLPNVGYTHVGKKVVLTPYGDMIIDPNALEQRPWTGETAGFAYHRKASYLLAMRAWCVRHHGMTYTPVFWPFPVRPEDKRRFAGAFPNGEDVGGRRVASKIIRMDAMVDALGIGDTELANMAVVEKWARLTRRVLLNDTLSKS